MANREISSRHDTIRIMGKMDRLYRAIEEWRHVLPPEGVLTDDALDVYRANCLSVDRSIAASLRPTGEAEVVHIVQIASRYKVPLYPISTGHNWGYGTSLPVAENCVIVDLSRMNRILQMDPELGLITLEPLGSPKGSCLNISVRPN